MLANKPSNMILVHHAVNPSPVRLSRFQEISERINLKPRTYLRRSVLRSGFAETKPEQIFMYQSARVGKANFMPEIQI